MNEYEWEEYYNIEDRKLSEKFKFSSDWLDHDWSELRDGVLEIHIEIDPANDAGDE